MVCELDGSIYDSALEGAELYRQLGVVAGVFCYKFLYFYLHAEYLYEFSFQGSLPAFSGFGFATWKLPFSCKDFAFFSSGRENFFFLIADDAADDFYDFVFFIHRPILLSLPKVKGAFCVAPTTVCSWVLPRCGLDNLPVHKSGRVGSLCTDFLSFRERSVILVFPPFCARYRKALHRFLAGQNFDASNEKPFR